MLFFFLSHATLPCEYIFTYAPLYQTSAVVCFPFWTDYRLAFLRNIFHLLKWPLDLELQGENLLQAWPRVPSEEGCDLSQQLVAQWGSEKAIVLSDKGSGAPRAAGLTPGERTRLVFQSPHC